MSIIVVTYKCPKYVCSDATVGLTSEVTIFTRQRSLIVPTNLANMKLPARLHQLPIQDFMISTDRGITRPTTCLSFLSRRFMCSNAIRKIALWGLARWCLFKVFIPRIISKSGGVVTRCIDRFKIGYYNIFTLFPSCYPY